MTARVLLAAALVLATAVQAQPTPRVDVVVSPSAPRVGDVVTYTVTIEGGRGATVTGDDLEAPASAPGLDLVRRTPSLDATSSFNGRTERRLRWTYRATTPGETRIAPLSVRVGARVLTADAVRLTVRPAAAPSPAVSAPPALGADGLALRLEPDRRSLVVGEQVVVEVVLYADENAQPTETLALGAWGTPGFWREELDASVAVPRPTGGGRLAYTVERMALFPTRAGRLTIAPRRLRVSLIRYDPLGDPGDPFGGFFSPFRQRRETLALASEPLTLDVAPLPAGAPAAFTGAVGGVTLERRVDRTAVAVDEPVTVTVTLAGDANLATLPAPVLDVPTGVDVFGPDDVRTADRLGNALSSTRTLTYTLVPTAAGEWTLPALAWAFYDPDAQRYVTRTAPAVTIRVSGGAGGTATTPALVLATEARWRRSLPPAGLAWARGAGLAVPLTVVLGVAGVRRRRQRRREGPPPPPPATGSYAETEARVRAALAARGVAPGTPPEAVSSALAATGVSSDVAARLAGVLAACAQGRFAPGLAGTPPPAAVDAEATAALAALDARPTAPTRGRGALVALALLAATATAQAPPSRLFDEGARWLAEGDTAGAVAAWQAARAAGAARGQASADVERNLGLVALARADTARARLHLDAAARLDPLDRATRAADAEARLRAGAGPAAAGTRLARTVGGVGALALVALAVALAFAAAGAALAGRRRTARLVAGMTLVVALAAGAALADASRPRAAVASTTVVRAGPSPDAPETGQLPTGALVRPGASAAGWRYVRADGARGWIPDGALVR